MTEPTNDLEALADALFAMSDKLRVSGFLKDNANHVAYEKVVATFTALRSIAAPKQDAVERVAKALSEAGCADSWDNALDGARAAIAALRDQGHG